MNCFGQFSLKNQKKKKLQYATRYVFLELCQYISMYLLCILNLDIFFSIFSKSRKYVFLCKHTDCLCILILRPLLFLAMYTSKTCVQLLAQMALMFPNLIRIMN